MASRYFNTKKPTWRVNQNIQAQTLRVVGSDGKLVGILSKQEALKKAQRLELDLVEIAPGANPPVAKIINFAKFRYQQDKKEREAKLAEKKGSEVKEIWLTPFIADNDYQVRLSRIKEFLTEGHKVRVVVKFTGRQLAHREFGFELCKKVLKDTESMSKADGEAKFLGRQLIMMISPVKGKKVKGRSMRTGTGN